MKICDMNRLTLTLLLTILTLATMRAEDPMSRPVTSTYSLAAGRQHVQATYLSPIKYSGTALSARGLWSKAMPFNPESAVMHFDADMTFSDLLNPAETAKMIGLNAKFGWGMSWRKRMAGGWQVTAGGSVDLNGGAYYLLRNGNNPVEAIARAGIGGVASVSKTLKIGRLPILVWDRVKLPVTGVFFSPSYGETYYEIYLGNHKGLVHGGWFGNNFCLGNTLTATLDFGRTAMTVGYAFDAMNQWACNLNTRVITHQFVIGVIPGGLGLKKRAANINTVYSNF